MESKCTVLKVKISEILSKYEKNYNVVDLKLHPNRKAKMQIAYPGENKMDLQKSGCIFLMSLGGSLHNTRAKILTQLEEITKVYTHCTVLIIDSGHRLNLTSQDVRQEDALDLALELGQKFLRNHKSTFQRYEQHCKFEFVLGSQMQKLAEFNTYYEQINNLYQVNKNFQTSLYTYSKNFQQKKNSELSELQLHEKIINSNQYIIEELAVIACVRKEVNPRPSVLVYPGNLSIFVKLFPEFSGILKELLNFTIHLQQELLTKEEFRIK
eukprot:TRINITY_DN6084_c1_g1_i1.p1 TRINITY_DN6084_c1_g1~~TRINITY_DN6084_c1_g1_i1.p1  ORF type:complete len:268 (-),score=19.51 TRINITY_DN6084_c1_g1_i1:203-1006(-)